MKALPALLPFLLAASAASAQQVTLRGEVQAVAGTGGQFLVDCSNVELQSSTINLAPFVGSQTTIAGRWNGSFSSPRVEVTDIQIVAQTFEIVGSNKIGEVAILSISGSSTSVFEIYTSLGSFFVPFGSAGAVMLEPQTLSRVVRGVIGSEGNFQIKVPIPNASALIGTTIFGQGIKSPGVGSFFLTNADCRTIEG